MESIMPHKQSDPYPGISRTVNTCCYEQQHFVCQMHIVQKASYIIILYIGAVTGLQNDFRSASNRSAEKFIVTLNKRILQTVVRMLYTTMSFLKICNACLQVLWCRNLFKCVDNIFYHKNLLIIGHNIYHKSESGCMLIAKVLQDKCYVIERLVFSRLG